MLRNLIARWLDGWRSEPDPAALDTPDNEPDDEPLPDDATPEQEAAVAARYAARRARCQRQPQDRENAIAAGLVMASGLDGFESIYAIQAGIRQRMLDRALDREYWQHPPTNTVLN